MEIRERVQCVLRGEMPDRIPWLIYSGILPTGSFEREMRDMGLGLVVWANIYKAFMPNVRIENRTVGDYLFTTYRTPVGELRSKTRIGMRFQRPGGSWTIEHPVKNTKDLEALSFMIEDTVYEPDYESYDQITEDIGSDGVVTVWSDYTPLMKIIVRYMGYRTFAIMCHRNRDMVERLIEKIDRSYQKMFRIVAESPAEIVRLGDNIDSVLVSPDLFERYCLPYYNSYSAILKARGKIVISHMDGRLNVLKDLIARARLDVIEAFTPPPMGDLRPSVAKRIWKDKVIWMNLPEEVFFRNSQEIMQYVLELLGEIAPGKGYILGITEDSHPDHFKKGIKIVTETVNEKGNLPISTPLA